MKKPTHFSPSIFIQLPFCLTIFLLMLVNTPTKAQDDLSYQTPPKAIADLIDAAPTPGVSLSPSNESMLLLERPNLPSIEEVAQKELRLAGIRINPKTNGSSRSGHYTGLKIKSLLDGKEKRITGLPDQANIENLSWSPDGSKIVFTITKSNGLELWMADMNAAVAKKLTDAVINDAMSGMPYTWFSDNNTILYKKVLPNRGVAPEQNQMPKGPVIQENNGEKAPVRTYQDLLKTPYDVDLFKYYTSSQLMIADLKSGKHKAFGKPGIKSSMSTSPDGSYIMITTIQQPFSYLVPYSRFPFTVDIFDKKGNLVTQIAKIPMAENIPKGFGAVREGPRSFSWRNDQPATLTWVEAQDGGDPKKEVAIRDQMYVLKAPFTEKALKSISFKLRYGGVDWGTGDLAICYEWWWQNRQLITSSWQPDNPSAGKKVLFDRSWQDRYDAPGDFETHRNQYGRSVLLTADKGKTLFLTDVGASPEGNRPFVDEYDVATQKTKRLWRSEAPYYEYPISIIDEEKGLVLTRRESNDERPNFYMRDLKKGSTNQVTFFENPYKALEGIKKEMVQYKRADGVELTGSLYLPKGYDKEKDGPLPVFMWAYPREFKSAKAAGQVSDSPHEFIRIGWGSPLFWVTQGYAIFDDFSMPIIGEGDEEPNETFVKQLTEGAEAAIDKLVDMGVADRDRIAVGGHSYGAFMTANLLAHTDLFAAGIARSGAYNRTLTPFGFQSEERTFWETPDTYFKMSPFMHADSIDTPLLLVHGDADNNSGTYPMQSERFFKALKGHGATTRLVLLPHESHGYRAKESILHTLWEMDIWLEQYVKDKL